MAQAISVNKLLLRVKRVITHNMLFCVKQILVNIALQTLIVLSFYQSSASFSNTFIQLMFLTVILNFWLTSIKLC